jgi:hypothetical protein
MTDKPSFEISADAEKLVTYLENHDSATYEEMNSITGRVINGGDRYVLYAAMNVLQRERQRVFVCQRGVGYVLAKNNQVASLSTDHVIARTRNVVKKGRKLQPIVNTQALTNDERDRFFKNRAVTQVIEHSISRKMRDKVADEIAERGGDMVDVDQVVALFKKRAH